MKKHTLISLFWLFGSLCFAQKTQIWLGPTYTVIPKSVAQSSFTFSNTETNIIGKDTSYFNIKSSFNRFDSLKFKTNVGVSAGIRWEKNLNTHFSLSCGLGLTYYKFNVVTKSGFEDFEIIEKTPIPKPNVPIRILTNTQFIRSNEKIKEGTDFKITELQIPLILNWKKTDFSIGIGAQLSTPILLNTYQETFIFESIDENTFKETKRILENKSLGNIKRSSIDLCANYTQWMDRVGLEIGLSRKMTNFWDSNNDNNIFFSSSSKEISIHKVNPIALSLRVIYMLK
jgi:hypothetical protein